MSLQLIRTIRKSLQSELRPRNICLQILTLYGHPNNLVPIRRNIISYAVHKFMQNSQVNAHNNEQIGSPSITVNICWNDVVFAQRILEGENEGENLLNWIHESYRHKFFHWSLPVLKPFSGQKPWNFAEMYLNLFWRGHSARIFDN